MRNGMLKIEIIDPIVFTSLKAAFPKASAAENGLRKYVALLEDMLNESELRGITSFNQKLGTYSLSLSALNKASSTLTTDKKEISIYTWLKDNKLSLHDVKILGGKFGLYQGLSIIKQSDFIKIEEVDDRHDPYTAFNKLHPNFNKLTQCQIDSDYDSCGIDIASLDNYIHNLFKLKKARKLSNQDRTAYIQAMRISAAAKYKNKVYYQKKKLSLFGRTYYEGLSVQNVRKDLRAAMLGNCFEYDMCSSVVAWKLGYAQACIDANKKLKGKSVQTAFPQCYQYWKDKSVLINAIKAHVFINWDLVDIDDKQNDIYSNYDDKEQTALIKSAMTALNFGARLSSFEFTNKQGKEQKVAIAEIFKDNEYECDKFLKFPDVKAFVSEQKLLNKTIMNIEKLAQPNMSNLPFLLNTRNTLQQQKALAYLYQNSETNVMNIVRANTKLQGLTVLANIHDAIIFKSKLKSSVLKKIHEDIVQQTGNTFWLLKEKQLHRMLRQQQTD
jgi:hypothetical protein